MDHSDQVHSSNWKKNIAILVLLAFGIGVLFFIAVWHLGTTPEIPDGGATLKIERGMSVQSIAQEAQKAGVVRSSLFLYAILTYAYDPTMIFAGTYRFTSEQSVYEVARKLASREVDETLRKITIPEGVTRKAIARIAEAELTDFDTELFLDLTKNNEGYLFPETYFVPEEYDAEEFVNLLISTYTNELEPYKDDIAASPFTENEVLILASLLEREANDETSMRTVSGILQNRLEINMALQTDSSIEYVLDKPLSELTPQDLQIDTPYNTYLYPGLVPTPIGNPGLQAIEAVLYPIESDYFYYITGDDGNFYYARTFDEHRANIRMHLQ